MAIPFYDNLDLNNNKISNVGTPESNTDVSNKQYVDGAITVLRTEINQSILTEINGVTDYIDGKVSTINTTISDLDSSVNTRIISNIVDDLYTSDSEKSLSAKQGVELRTQLETLNTAVSSVNNYNSVEDGEIGPSGRILGYDYIRCLIPIFIDEPVVQQINDFDLSQKIGNIAVVFKVSAFVIENGIIHYINTDDMKLINYDIQQAILKLEFSQTLLSELENNTLYLIVEYYNDANYEIPVNP